MSNVVLVEWVYKGRKRHQACESEASLTSCLYVLGTPVVAPDVRDLVVWDAATREYLTSMGMCGHA